MDNILTFFQELDKLINKVCKKFKEHLECWLHACECFFQVNENSKARYLFQRALKSLPKKERRLKQCYLLT